MDLDWRIRRMFLFSLSRLVILEFMSEPYVETWSLGSAETWHFECDPCCLWFVWFLFWCMMATSKKKDFYVQPAHVAGLAGTHGWTHVRFDFFPHTRFSACYQTVSPGLGMASTFGLCLTCEISDTFSSLVCCHVECGWPLRVPAWVLAIQCQDWPEPSHGACISRCPRSSATWFCPHRTPAAMAHPKSRAILAVLHSVPSMATRTDLAPYWRALQLSCSTRDMASWKLAAPPQTFQIPSEKFWTLRLQKL